MMRFLPILLCALTVTACSQLPDMPEDVAEATSLLGDPLAPIVIDSLRRAALEEDLFLARMAMEEHPDDADALIWYGRRLAYLGRYRAAIDAFTQGYQRHRDDARFLRHRGHRFITIRAFDLAISDLERAAVMIEGVPDEVEPDGMPNRYNIPTSTLASNIWYHLGLARFLSGDFESALDAYRQAMDVATTTDMRVATADWLYMTLRRLGRHDEAAEVLAPFGPDVTVLENESYLRRIRLYRGELTPEELLEGEDDLALATQGFGLANWHLVRGETEQARLILQRVLDLGNWPAFGHIAAEADMARGLR
jgi:tetratricopeptide (TPR) repeat protein